jgi:amino acid transporter
MEMYAHQWETENPFTPYKAHISTCVLSTFFLLFFTVYILLLRQVSMMLLILLCFVLFVIPTS